MTSPKYCLKTCNRTSKCQGKCSFVLTDKYYSNYVLCLTILLKVSEVHNEQDHDLFLLKLTSILNCDSFNRFQLNATLERLPLSSLPFVPVLIACPDVPAGH